MSLGSASSLSSLSWKVKIIEWLFVNWNGMVMGVTRGCVVLQFH